MRAGATRRNHDWSCADLLTISSIRRFGQKLTQRHPAVGRQVHWLLAVHRLRQPTQGVAIEVCNVDPLPHRRREGATGVVTVAACLGAPARHVRHISRQRPCLGFQVVQQGLNEERFDAVQFASTHAGFTRFPGSAETPCRPAWRWRRAPGWPVADTLSRPRPGPAPGSGTRRLS